MATQLAIPGAEELARRDEVSPLTILHAAVQSGASIETLERLTALAERHAANAAKEQFDKAMAAFKANPPQIRKTATGNYGRYADLGDITTPVISGLAAVGLSHKFKPVPDKDGKMGLKCVLQGFGHEEDSDPIYAPLDTSGSKNALQSLGSTLTYLQRYSLLMACGLAASQDTDGDTVGGLDDLRERVEYIQNCRDMPELQKVYATHYKAAAAAKDKKSMAAIMNAYNARKKELS